MLDIRLLDKWERIYICKKLNQDENWFFVTSTSMRWFGISPVWIGLFWTYVGLSTPISFLMVFG